MKAILSTMLLQADGTYEYKALSDTPEIRDIPHYVGHPATKHLLDQAGAVYVQGLFSGLQPGEGFYVAQLKDPRKGQAFTKDNPNVEPGDLKWGVVRRLS
jgi:hypothetical protein